MQTAVEYLQDHFKTLIQEDKKGLYKLLFEQAKELEKIQIIKANRDGVDMVVDKKPFIMGKDYFAETYGSKGSDDKYVCYKCKNLTDNKFEVCNECNVGFTSSQTEISDEEIEKFASDFYDNNGADEFIIMGAKWYREQLKQKI